MIIMISFIGIITAQLYYWTDIDGLNVLQNFTIRL